MEARTTIPTNTPAMIRQEAIPAFLVEIRQAPDVLRERFQDIRDGVLQRRVGAEVGELVDTLERGHEGRRRHAVPHAPTRGVEGLALYVS